MNTGTSFVGAASGGRVSTGRERMGDGIDEAGGFRLLDILGRGGMGVVYRATGPDGRPAAVKRLVQLDCPDDSLRRRFEREGAIRLDHPNICRVLDAGLDKQGTPYIAFELLEGQNLAARLERARLSPAEAVAVGTQVCDALWAAHAEGVIHRDLKPSNLFLLPDGTVKLLDFGVAQWSEGRRTSLTAEGSLVGTPWYVSPEQARGQPDIDATTDLWSLGAVLYETLAGRPPFARNTALASVIAVLMEEPIPLTSCVPGCPPELARVIGRALRKARGERWPSAAAFGEALRTAELVPDERDGARASVLPPGEQRVVAVLLAQGVRDAAAIERSVIEAGGIFLRLLGGRALGLFGGETWEGDEVLRAAMAALRSRAATAQMAVSSGRAASGEGGVSGTALQAAEAACALNLAGVGLDETGARALGGALVVRRANETTLEVVADQAAPWPPALREQELPLIGRTAELAQLRMATDALLQERRSTCVLVTGPPGIGKSRLRAQLEQVLGEAGTEVWVGTGRAEPLHGRAAFSLLASVLRQRAIRGAQFHGWPRLEPEAAPHARREVVRRLSREATDEPATPEVDTAAATPAPAPAHDLQVVADRFHMALFNWIEGLCRRGPVALLLEDLQWADQASLRLLDDLAEALADYPFLLLGTARPELLEQGAEPFPNRAPLRLRLQGLPPAEVERLAGAVAGRVLPAHVTRAIADRTAGNPLFVREIVLALDETPAEAGAEGELPLPITVEAAVQSRLDHLLAAEKSLCKQAAVLARPFTAEEAEALGTPCPEPFLASLVRKDVLVARPRSAGGRDREFRFRSTLVADVAYRMLADDARRDLHRRASAFLARSPAAAPEEVAHHYDRGDEAAQASAWYVRAVLAAAARGDSAGVVRCAERSLALGVPDDALFTVHNAYAEALGYVGRRDDQAAQLERTLPHAREPAARARVRLNQAEHLWRTGRTEEALALGEEAAVAAGEANDRALLATVRGWQGITLVVRDRPDEAGERLQEAEELAGDAPPRTRAYVATCRTMLAAAKGDLAGQRAAMRDAVELYRKAGDARRAAGAEVNLASLHNRLGSYREAIAALEAAREGCRRVGWRSREGWALCSLGYALAMDGRAAAALDALDQAWSIARTLRETRLEVLTRLYRARALLLAGTPSLPEAEAAAEDAERHGMNAQLVGALVLAARAQLARNRHADALALSQRAFDLRERLGSLEEDEAEVFQVHADALAACGRCDEAGRVRRDGRDHVLRSASRIADADVRTRFLQDVPAHRALVDAGTWYA
jgi:tetratricopeptide (TPR) repeat protein